MSSNRNLLRTLSSSTGVGVRAPKTLEPIPIDTFPSELQGILSETFDKDGNGFIDAQELFEAANLCRQTKAANTLIRKGAIFLATFSVCLLGVMGGLTYGIVRASKDTEVLADRKLMTTSPLMTTNQEPVSTSTNEIKLTLATLPFVPPSVIAKVEDLAFLADDGEKMHFRKTLSVDVIPDSFIEIKTTAGDIIKWDLEDSDVTNITLKDGTTWPLCVASTSCTATNVFTSDEVMQGIKNFEEMASESRRRNNNRQLWRCDRFTSGF